MIVEFKHLTQFATTPTQGSDGAIGLDLYAAHDVTLGFGRVDKAGTGLSVAIPEGHYGRIAPRSGLAAKHGVGVLAGVIDSDYRGELIVLLTLHNNGEHLDIKKGDRIAQLILERATIPDLVRVVGLLPTTERDSAGFGSTGQ